MIVVIQYRGENELTAFIMKNRLIGWCECCHNIDNSKKTIIVFMMLIHMHVSLMMFVYTWETFCTC